LGTEPRALGRGQRPYPLRRRRDAALPADALAGLKAAFPTETARRLPFPYSFAVPAAVLREGDTNTGCTEIMSPWGDAVSQGAE